MTPKELEEHIEELEKRVDRLRALYEQYFLGIERLEPQVLRKDVDRRFYVLRREKIRNTAVRFKFQQVLQRYTTYQNYWQRIARQIEEGTYRRDVMKVRQRLIEQREQRRLARMAARGELPAGQTEAAQGEQDVEVDVDVDVELPGAAPQDDGLGMSEGPPMLASGHAGFGDIEVLGGGAPAPAVVTDEADLTFGAPRGESASGSGTATLGRLSLKRVVQTTPLPLERSQAPAAVEPPAAQRPSAPPASARALAELIGPDLPPGPPLTVPAVTSGPAQPSSAPPAAPVRPVRPPLPQRPTTRPGASAEPPKRATPPPRAARPLAEPLPPELAPPRAPVSPPAAPPATPAVTRPAPPVAPPPPAARPAPPPAPAAPRAATAPSPAPDRAAASPPASTDLRALFLKRPKAAATPAPAPPSAAAPARTAPAPSAPAAPAGRGTGPGMSARGPELPDQRVREIYDRYAQERRRNNEGEVRYETVAKSIRDMLPKLEEKANGKKVDFEVVVKDGKTVLKPVTK